LSQYRSSGLLLHESRGLKYAASLEDKAIQLDIQSRNAGTSAQLQATANDAILATVDEKIWSNLVSNGSNVYLHTFVMSDKLAMDKKLEISLESVRSGAVLHGVVQMVKYDPIPPYFRHRYLLSDFGLAEMDPLDGMHFIVSCIVEEYFRL
jgi:hypothetical protein